MPSISCISPLLGLLCIATGLFSVAAREEGLEYIPPSGAVDHGIAYELRICNNICNDIITDLIDGDQFEEPSDDWTDLEEPSWKMSKKDEWSRLKKNTQWTRPKYPDFWAKIKKDVSWSRRRNY